MLSFEIGRRESGFYSERTDTQSDTAIQYGMYIDSRTPAFGGISLALRGNGAFGAPVGETAAFGGGERREKNKKNKNLGCQAPQK